MLHGVTAGVGDRASCIDDGATGRIGSARNVDLDVHTDAARLELHGLEAITHAHLCSRLRTTGGPSG